jgi:hypothetical protein
VRCIKTILLVFLVSTSLYADDGLVFQYAFVVKTGSDTVASLDTSGTHTRIDPDSRVRILLRPVKNAYCYLFLHDAEGNLTVLFPDQYNKPFDDDGYVDTLYSIPGATSWLVPNGENGTESFYIIVSEVRLAGLESLVESYLRVPETAGDTRKKSADEIVAEMTMLRRVHSSFSEKTVSPVVIAGDYRGDDGSARLPSYMVEVRAHTFYAKTVRLVH